MAELKIPSQEEMAKEIADKALDEFEYKGMTIRQRADKITSGEYEPMVYAVWIDCSTEWEQRCKCSACGQPVSRWWSKTKRCPECGARMSKEKPND